MEPEINSAAQALNSIIQILGALDDDTRERVVKAVATFFHVESSANSEHAHNNHLSADRSTRPSFSHVNAPSPKEFLIEKQPRTDVERIATLAYYLTNFRDMPHFKTLDLAKLNTEAAQPKFSNSAYASTNALNMGYLASGAKGMRQLSAAGEQFVRALPDRESAKAAMTRARPRRLQRRKK
jgi:hypothetical protein